MNKLLAALLLLIATVNAVAADPDFNNDGVVNQKDVDDFLSVYSEGLCSTGNCDSIDINGDGSLFDPDDQEAYLNRVRWGLPVIAPWRPPVDEFGATIIPQATWTILVSSSKGNDANDGISAPVRTIARAYAIAGFRSNVHILFRKGDVWDEPFRGEYGPWEKGGINQYEPMVLSSYSDDGSPLNPKFTYRTPDSATEAGNTIKFQGDRFTGHIWIIGLDFEPVEGTKSHIAINVYAPRQGIVIEGCRFVGGSSAAVFDGTVSHGLNKTVFRRNYIGYTKDAGDGGHSGGCYIVNAEEFLFENNVLEHVGWGEVREEHNKFNQGVYVVASLGTFQERPFVAQNNLIIAPGHAGIQLRAGLTYAVFNEVRNAPIGISGGHAMAAANNPWKGNIANNTIVGWDAIPRASQGECIRVSRGDGAWVFNNTFVNPRQSIVYEQPLGNITFLGNVVNDN